MSEAQLAASENGAATGNAAGETSGGAARHALPSPLLHDLRTPLNQIIGYAEMLEEQAQEEGRADFVADLGRVRAAGRQLLGLINTSFLPLRAPAPDAASTAAPVVLAVSPTRATPPGPPAVTPEADGSEPLASGTGQGLLLVVDDNETNRDVLARRLERQGYATAMAENGQQALDMVRARSFDLVLLDIMMPEMDGYEVLRQLKADAGLRHLPVIMISALNELDSVVRCIEMGAEDYLPKPFNPTLLKARVVACLDKKRSHDREMRLFAQLQENYKRLQELEKMRDDLTHMIVHDLRTPLSSLLAGLQTMPELAPLEADQMECYDIALRGGETLLSMINDLLDISKMESGTFTLELAPVSISALLEAGIEQIASAARDKQLSLARQVAPDLPPVTGDADKLRRILVNLLGNALKFTPNSGTITVSVRRTSDTPDTSDGGEGESLLFAVSDTGEGIPPTAFARIFEKFGQVESRQAGRQMSTGLGLTFCKMAVEAHGGRIWVESTLGQGSTFCFTIPLLQG